MKQFSAESLRVGVGRWRSIALLSTLVLLSSCASPQRADSRPDARPPRVAVQAQRAQLALLSPLSYGGGFQPKTMVYETLVERDAEGHIVPELAERWEVADDGRSFRFELREGARFHDGAAVDAESVRIHFKRWVGLPEHGWLGANERIQSVVVESPRSFRVELDEPYALLSDLCAINPCAIRGPGALDRNGAFVHPVGSGPWRYVGRTDEGHDRFEFVAAALDESRFVDLVAFDSESKLEPMQALLRGDVDLVVDGWYESVPRDAHVPDGFQRFDGPGSSVWYLSFRLEGPTADLGLRHDVFSAVDRDELIARVEHGHADPATGWAASTVRVWPRVQGGPLAGRYPPKKPLDLLVRADVPREVALATLLREQLGAYGPDGLPVAIHAVEPDEYTARLAAGDFDLRIEHTWGVPYDPFLSLRARFLPPPSTRSAADQRFFGVDPRLTDLVARASRIPTEAARAPLYTEIQQLLLDERLIVPLYVPRRLGVARLGAARAVPLDHDLYRTRLEGLPGDN